MQGQDSAEGLGPVTTGEGVGRAQNYLPRQKPSSSRDSLGHNSGEA